MRAVWGGDYVRFKGLFMCWLWRRWWTQGTVKEKKYTKAAEAQKPEVGGAKDRVVLQCTDGG